MNEHEESPYFVHPVTVKLSQQQVDEIEASGEPASQWIRSAINDRLRKERLTDETQVHYDDAIRQ